MNAHSHSHRDEQVDPKDLKVSVQELSPIKKAVQIEVPAEIVMRAFNQAVAHLQSEVHWPGFRPGKVPVSLLLKKYEENLTNQVMRTLVPECFEKAVRNLGLSVVDAPQIQNMDMRKDAPLSFTALVEVLPEVQLAGYAGLLLPQREIPVVEDDIEKRLGALQEQHGYLENYPDDHSILLSDYVTIDLVGEVEGKPLPGGMRKGYSVCVGSKTLRPEIEEALLGKKKGELFSVDTAIPADDPEKKLAGKTAHFKIDIRDVKIKRLPALDDEFAKDLGAASFLELKEQVKTALIEERRAEVKRDQKRLLVKRLIELHPMDIPSVVTQRELKSLVQKVDFGEGPGSESYKILEAMAEERVKEVLILKAISKEEKIEAEDQELEQAIQVMSQRRGISFEKGKREMMQDPHLLEGLKETIQREKALEHVYSLARFEEIKEREEAAC